MKELIKIQTELKAPKNQRNSFGNYNYRSCEDILEALKPLLKENNCMLNITDELVQLGERYYVKSTATISNVTEKISASAYAREALNKKGMDDSQITGATSSYARKYALNGLFAIDDTKDADATNKHGQDQDMPQIQTKTAQNEEITKKTSNDIPQSQSIVKSQNNAKKIDVVPIGRNKGKNWSELDSKTLEESIIYYNKLIDANPESPYRKSNEAILDHIASILLSRGE
jgi:hypothetical protein